MKKTLVIFALLSLSFASVKSQNIDVRIVEGIQSCRSTGMDNTMSFISNSAYVITPAVPIALLAGGLIRHDNEMLGACAQMGVSIGLSAAFVFGLKEIIKRPRPYEAYPLLIDEVSGESGYSMPSAHTSFAFSTATSLSLQYKKWYVIAPSFLWAGTVAYSRMYLGDHYPSDVLVGACIGALTAFATYKLEKMLLPKKPSHQAVMVKIL